MKGKFETKWKGPYIIEQVYDGGAYQLIDSHGVRPMPPINVRFLKEILKFLPLLLPFDFLIGETFSVGFWIHDAFSLAFHGYI